jgi:hypothetical protein
MCWWLNRLNHNFTSFGTFFWCWNLPRPTTFFRFPRLLPIHAPRDAFPQGQRGHPKVGEVPGGSMPNPMSLAGEWTNKLELVGG